MKVEGWGLTSTTVYTYSSDFFSPTYSNCSKFSENLSSKYIGSDKGKVAG
jgi:hypothetical protein